MSCPVITPVYTPVSNGPWQRRWRSGGPEPPLPAPPAASGPAPAGPAPAAERRAVRRRRWVRQHAGPGGCPRCGVGRGAHGRELDVRRRRRGAPPAGAPAAGLPAAAARGCVPAAGVPGPDAGVRPLHGLVERRCEHVQDGVGRPCAVQAPVRAYVKG